MNEQAMKKKVMGKVTSKKRGIRTRKMEKTRRKNCKKKGSQIRKKMQQRT
jgi:hypothetical protein